MLQISNIHCYADDSTGYASYTARANMSRDSVDENRNKLVSEIETMLCKGKFEFTDRERERYTCMMRREAVGVRSRIKEELFTCWAFCVAVSALPALAVSYVVVRISKQLWLKLLSSRYPRLDFIKHYTVRTLLDTQRNQGIINVLLSVKGVLNVDDIKRELTQHVIERRNQNGELMFPRLRHVLISCWGNYAWDANVPFRAENHIVVANAVHRGRPVSESNLQDYVSEIISKYFPTDHPPWQYIIIPCVSLEPKYYILVRVHHLLLTGKQSLSIGDFLLMEQSNRMLDQIDHSSQSPLSKLLPTPSAIPELWSKLNESLSNVWNEFIYFNIPISNSRSTQMAAQNARLCFHNDKDHFDSTI
ncbi:uncharacterized protein LOC126964824 isoform X2 [Leptidea sinapis]|uniref:uncharacterized protein LOC126964824 isoform X2 n=1 Tax=Leptidea sinapis TaxID=189913 RepID=UPI0021C496C8|nr:uncharacterized protein LOC126964824 isoform X2 [Leptidea sinapis]